MLEQPAGGDVDAAIAAFESAVERLRALEAEGEAADPALAGSEVFRDPERMADAEAAVAAALAALAPMPAPVAVFTRDRYEIAPCNQFAVHASEAVMREPGKRYNPLVLHGAPGVGKSHLLHAIGNELAKAPGARVACAKAQTFVDELIAALEAGTVERWRARWREVSALILDDAQAIAGTERAQEELFHLFNTLHAAGTQIVLAFDCAPQQLETLEDRLRSRFAGGLVVEIRSPDATLRQRLYRHTLQRIGIAVPSDVLSYLARRESDDVREIVATADQLARAAQELGVDITLGFARRLLDDVPTPSPVAAMAVPARQSVADVAGGDAFFLDREKTIWEWPEVGGRAIEELR
jgi:chromosomal replication initiator protein